MSLTTQERASLLAGVDSLRAAIEAIVVSDVDVPALQAQLAEAQSALTAAEASLSASLAQNASLTTQIQDLTTVADGMAVNLLALGEQNAALTAERDALALRILNAIATLQG